MKDKILALSPIEFENLTFDLVQLLGLKNCVWRTPGSDGGRDIQGDFLNSDFSNSIRVEKWYIECKRYDKTIDWATIWKKIAFADVHEADLLLFITTSEISPQAKSEIDQWNQSHRFPIVRFWDIHSLIRNLNAFPVLLIKYRLIDNRGFNIQIFNSNLLTVLKKYIYIDSGFKGFNNEKGNKYVSKIILNLVTLIDRITIDFEKLGSFSRSYYNVDDENYNRFKSIVPFNKFLLDTILSILDFHEKKESSVYYEDANDKYMINIQLSKPLPITMHEDINSILQWDNEHWNIEYPANSLELNFIKRKS